MLWKAQLADVGVWINRSDHGPRAVLDPLRFVQRYTSPSVGGSPNMPSVRSPAAMLAVGLRGTAMGLIDPSGCRSTMVSTPRPQPAYGRVLDRTLSTCSVPLDTVGGDGAVWVGVGRAGSGMDHGLDGDE